MDCIYHQHWLWHKISSHGNEPILFKSHSKSREDRSLPRAAPLLKRLQQIRYLVQLPNTAQLLAYLRRASRNIPIFGGILTLLPKESESIRLETDRFIILPHQPIDPDSELSIHTPLLEISLHSLLIISNFFYNQDLSYPERNLLHGQI